MKKVLFAAVLLVSSNAIFAQVSKGNILAGGSAGFNSSKTGDYKVTTIDVSPDLGYFFIDQFAGGLSFSYSHSKTKLNSNSSTTNSTWLAPFVRYYFMPSGQKVNVFADGSYGFGSSKTKGSSSVSANYYQIKAGPAIFLAPSAALEFALYYRSYGGDAFEEDRNNNFGLSIGFQVHLGGGAAKK
jgi:hypothetical protein